MYQLSRLMRRERQVLRADHQRDQEVAEHRRDRRDQEEEHHHDAVHREQLVVGVGRDEVALRRHQLEADQPTANSAAEEEEHRDRDQVQQRDPLVVLRQQPRLEAVAVVQVVALGSLQRVDAWLTSSRRRRCTGRRRALVPPRRPWPPATRDFMYSISCTRLLFADQPLEGRHERLEPATIFACGFRIDSRR